MAIRDREKINVRWPLAKLEIQAHDENYKKLILSVVEIIKNQLNVKNVSVVVAGRDLSLKVEGAVTDYANVKLDLNLTKDLEEEGYARELMRRIQQLRKESGLKKQDEIELYIKFDVNLSKWSKQIQGRCGAKIIKFESLKNLKYLASGDIKGKKFEIGFN